MSASRSDLVQFQPGALVRVRDREWVVQPDSSPELLHLRPLTGSDAEAIAILTALESVESTSFAPPDSTRLGDHRACALLRDAVRLQVRAAAGPFRSFAKIAVEPRSYQLVPLLLALRLDVVRVLIADDVGIGKTIEAGLIAKELLERGEADGLCVLCPPHLAEQWQRELRDKFHIDAELVLPATAPRLERGLRTGQSLFDRYPFTIVSLDFIKQDGRRSTFVRTVPNLVIVDEAHTCASGAGRHQRHSLVHDLAQSPERHMVLVTATPHSGDESAFRSLLALLDPDFANLPEDLTKDEAKVWRQRLARQLVQRRRADIRVYLDDETSFPSREGERDATWHMSAEYERFFRRVLDYASELVASAGRDKRRRVHWWSALAALRSVGSSPAAAAATLRNRAPHADLDDERQIDAMGEKAVLDLDESEGLEGVDLQAGADDSPTDSAAAAQHSNRRRLLELAREAERFRGRADTKLAAAETLVRELLRDGFHPILFCRFIPTAEYVAHELKQRLRDVDVRAVTGLMPHDAREQAIEELAQSEARVLVCTDCLSEGINLQTFFDAVVHYDLAWNPTRHEQREGRVDRYGQLKSTVRLVTLFGDNSPIDGIVLDVLLRKHKKIRSALGVSVAMPESAGKVIDALMEGLLLRGRDQQQHEQLLPGMAEWFRPRREVLHKRWEDVAEQERRSRTLFAQESLKPAEVLPELEAVRSAIGARANVAAFVATALESHGAIVRQGVSEGRAWLEATLADSMPKSLRLELKRQLREQDLLRASFELPTAPGALHLPRTHPVVETLASFLLDQALDPQSPQSAGRRAGAIRTSAVARRTTLLLLRRRYQVHETRGARSISLLVEDVGLLAFAGAPERPEWLDTTSAESLLAAAPAGNLLPDQARDAVQKVLAGLLALDPALASEAQRHGRQILDAHRRVRKAAQHGGVKQSIELKPPVDVLGVYLFLPATV